MARFEVKIVATDSNELSVDFFMASEYMTMQACCEGDYFMVSFRTNRLYIMQSYLEHIKISDEAVAMLVIFL